MAYANELRGRLHAAQYIETARSVKAILLFTKILAILTTR